MQQRIAEVWVNIPTRRINKLFTYAVPKHLSCIGEGWRVWIPFGSRRVEGFVVETREGDIGDLKEILEVWDTAPWFDTQMMTLAKWIAEYYLCTLGEALRLFIPGGSSATSEPVYRLAQEETSLFPGVNQLSEDVEAVWQFIKKTGVATHKAIIRKFGSDHLYAIQTLLERKYILREFTAKSRTSACFQTEYHPALSQERLQSAIGEMRGKAAQRRVLELLLNNAYLNEQSVKEHKIARPVLQKLIAAGFIRENKIRVLRDSYRIQSLKQDEHILTKDQQSAYQALKAALEEKHFAPFLLHGITGSGKTQVYIEAAAFARSQHRQVIVLVPEIALTSQLVERFQARFSIDVTVIHSRLSLAERNDTWERIRSGQAGIVIGARSAIFAPFTDLGLVILDEEHEFTYKQEETPRYHAREVALMRCRLSGAVAVFGSATPAVETYYKSLSGEFALLSMPNRVSGDLAQVTVVDMREELKKGNRSVISKPLYEMLAQSFARNEQAIILLNRRGYATFILCRECGHVIQCPHCSVSLVYHASGGKLKCHYCQRSSAVPDLCPNCRSRYIRYFGSGTQKVEEELGKLFPHARVLRMDQDTTSGKFSHQHILQKFAAGEYHVLLGTQMVAKGHDIKNVTAVGVIAADAALNLPDFRASEKTFALIMQAAGRAGRGQQPGHVVIQTYNPEHYAIQTGAEQDYLAFYQSEIAFRKALGYPPFSRIVKVTVQGPNERGIRHQAEEIAQLLKRGMSDAGAKVDVLGPFAAAVSKVDDIYRMNILVKAESLDRLQEVFIQLELNAQPGIIIDVDPVNVM